MIKHSYPYLPVESKESVICSHLPANTICIVIYIIIKKQKLLRLLKIPKPNEACTYTQTKKMTFL